MIACSFEQNIRWGFIITITTITISITMIWILILIMMLMFIMAMVTIMITIMIVITIMITIMILIIITKYICIKQNKFSVKCAQVAVKYSVKISVISAGSWLFYRVGAAFENAL